MIPGKPCILSGRDERGFTRSHITQLSDPFTEQTYCALNYGVPVETKLCKHDTPGIRDLDMAILSELVGLAAGHASPDLQLHPRYGDIASPILETILGASIRGRALSCKSRASLHATWQLKAHPSFSYSHYNAFLSSWIMVPRHHRKAAECNRRLTATQIIAFVTCWPPFIFSCSWS